MGPQSLDLSKKKKKECFFFQTGLIIKLKQESKVATRNKNKKQKPDFSIFFSSRPFFLPQKQPAASFDLGKPVAAAAWSPDDAAAAVALLGDGTLAGLFLSAGFRDDARPRGLDPDFFLFILLPPLLPLPSLFPVSSLPATPVIARQRVLRPGVAALALAVGGGFGEEEEEGEGEGGEGEEERERRRGRKRRRRRRDGDESFFFVPFRFPPLSPFFTLPRFARVLLSHRRRHRTRVNDFFKCFIARLRVPFLARPLFSLSSLSSAPTPLIPPIPSTPLSLSSTCVLNAPTSLSLSAT